MEKIKYTILIPLFSNDGVRLSVADLEEIYNEFYLLGDGYTLAGDVHGAYRMKDGAKRLDQSGVVWVGIDAGQEAELKEVVARICARLKQESIYLERCGGTIEFIGPADAGDQP